MACITKIIIGVLTQMPKSSMITNVVTVASLLWTLVASSYFNVLVLYVVMNPSFLLSKFTTLTHNTDCRNPKILQSFQPNSNRLDVYLGVPHCTATVDGLDHALQGGWLGWIPYHERMSYGDAQVLITEKFPVSIYMYMPMIYTVVCTMCDSPL